MKRLVQSSWFVALMGCVMYLATTAALFRPEAFAGARASAEKPNPTSITEASWKFRNPEFEQWIQELKTERLALDERELQLQEFQKRLEAERQEVLSVTQKVYQLQVEFDKTVVRFTDQQLENAKRQTKVITGMSSEGAATMIREMPQDDAVRLLFGLKADRSATILDTLSKLGRDDAKRASEIAERLRQVIPPTVKKKNGPAN